MWEVERIFLLNKILDLSKSDIEIEIDSSKFRPIDIPVIRSDITKLKKTIDWEPEIIIEETINDTLNYWREKICGGNMNDNTKENLKI
jgi:GDP-4-dehydro-6-deoxy-D-mannose reductase